MESISSIHPCGIYHLLSVFVVVSVDGCGGWLTLLFF
jgi:hypothetical protein